MTHMTHMTHSENTVESSVILEKSELSRARGWCLTINTYNTGDIEDLKNCEAETIVFQSEIGKNGTQHLQCVLYFKNARSFKSIKKMFPRAHIEQCRNLTASTNYCSKRESHDGVIRFRQFKNKIICDETEESLTLTVYKKKLDKDELKREFRQWLIEDLIKNPEDYTEIIPKHWSQMGQTDLI